MPCSGLAGFEYIDAVVSRDFDSSYREALRSFVLRRLQLVVPHLDSANYDYLNETEPDVPNTDNVDGDEPRA